jgi:predicted permease
VMMEEQLIPGGDQIHNHKLFWLPVVGRLKPGVRLEQAQQELSLLIQPIVRQYPEEHKGHETVTLSPLWRAPFGANALFSTLFPMLLVISGLVLLLACVNVANLLLVRSVGRRREIAIRLANGASRWRLLRQLLIESLVLSLAGGSIALGVTFWTSGSLMDFMPPIDFPLDLTASPDHTVLLATLVISTLTGIIFGVLPALRATSIPPAAVLKEESRSAAGSRGKIRLTSALVVAQISLSVLLLICAGLFIRSFVSAQRLHPGFNSQHVLLASYDLFPEGYTEATGIQFERRVVARLSALPGVEAVTVATRVPLGVGGGSTSVKPEGYVWQPHESMEVPEVMAGANYLHTLQIPLVAGRDLTVEDTESSQPVALVNQSFASRYWPNQNPLGKRIITDISDKTFIVVGVTEDTKLRDLNPPGPVLYLPLTQVYRSAMIVHLRVTGDPMTHALAVERIFHGLDPNLPLYDVKPLQTSIQLASVPTRIAGTFVGVFGLLALVLATVGVYGVISYRTRQRTPELAIRLALGADPRDVFRQVLGQGLRLALIGISIGLLVSFLLTRFLKSLLFGVTSTDLATFFTVSLVLCVVALLACFVPAWRTTQIDPMTALRYE